MMVDKMQTLNVLASLWLMTSACTSSLPEFKDSLAEGEQLVSLRAERFQIDLGIKKKKLSL
jgi:hypothetical protein